MVVCRPKASGTQARVNRGRHLCIRRRRRARRHHRWHPTFSSSIRRRGVRHPGGAPAPVACGKARMRASESAGARAVCDDARPRRSQRAVDRNLEPHRDRSGRALGCNLPGGLARSSNASVDPGSPTCRAREVRVRADRARFAHAGRAGTVRISIRYLDPSCAPSLLMNRTRSASSEALRRLLLGRSTLAQELKRRFSRFATMAPSGGATIAGNSDRIRTGQDQSRADQHEGMVGAAQAEPIAIQQGAATMTKAIVLDRETVAAVLAWAP